MRRDLEEREDEMTFSSPVTRQQLRLFPTGRCELVTRGLVLLASPLLFPCLHTGRSHTDRSHSRNEVGLETSHPTTPSTHPPILLDSNSGSIIIPSKKFTPRHFSSDHLPTHIQHRCSHASPRPSPCGIKRVSQVTMSRRSEAPSDPQSQARKGLVIGIDFGTTYGPSVHCLVDAP